MRESRRTNFLILAALLMIAAAFTVYATLVMRWFAAPKTIPAGTARSARTSTETALTAARGEFREHLLAPRAHLRLSEALWKAGRPVDAFYVMYAARQIFTAEDFQAAHADVVLRSTPEDRNALDQLSRAAMAPDGDAARTAHTKLEELYRADPKNPEKLAALAGADFGRGDTEQASALATEAWNKHPGHAGAARIMGMLALKDHDQDAALKWLTAAWDRNPDDLYSAAKLAQLYDKRRADPEGALPFYLALYRQNPDYADDERAETRIRTTLDARRESLLKGATVEGLGGRFKLDDASLRAETCLRAADYADPRWIDALGELLDDDVEMVRRSADYALFQIARKEPDAVRARRELWLGSVKPLTRVRALNLYADLDGNNALPAVVAALSHPNPGVRAFAKIMVLDHYYKGVPEAAAARTRYLAAEKDPEALALVKRFAGASR